MHDSREQQAKPTRPRQAATLTAVAETLLRYRVPPRQILDQARAVLERSPFDGTFAQVSAVRAVAEMAIAHKRSSANSVIEAEAHDSRKQQSPVIPHVGMLPWPKPAVLFLRGVLRYSRQDTALLLGMSDANIDQLHQFARKRIGCSSNMHFSASPDIWRLSREVGSHCSIRF